MPNDNKQPTDNSQQPAVTAPPPVLEDVILPPTIPTVQPSVIDSKQSVDTGSAAPSNDVVMNTTPISTMPRKKYAGGKIIATILGLFLLVGGLGAGVYLTQQNQNPEEKAAIECGYCSASNRCVTCSLGMQNRRECSTNDDCAASGGGNTGPVCINGEVDEAPCFNGQCQGTKTRTCFGSGQWGAWSTCQNTVCPNPGACQAGDEQACITTSNCPGIATCSEAKNWGVCIDKPGDGCADDINNCGRVGFKCPSGSVCSSGQCVNLQNDVNNCGGVNHVCQQGGQCVNGQCVPPTGSECNGSLPAVTSGNTSSITVVITDEMKKKCTNKCGDATLYASICTCSGINLTGGCNTNCQLKDVVGSSISADKEPTCGTVQVDVGCKNTHNTYGSLAFSSKQAATACSSTGGGGNNPTPSTAAITASCQNVKAYSTNNWTLLSASALSNLKGGQDSVYFCVTGVATGGSFDKARFTINGTLQAETTTVRPTSTDFCQLYTLPAGITSYNVTAEVHHVTLGWK